MAEIKIEKKTTMWPWILAAVILIGLLIYFFGFRDDNGDNNIVVTDTDTTEQKTNRTGVAASGAVAEYLRHVSDTGRTMGLDHVYTDNAFKKLTAAIKAKADEKGHDISADLSQIQEHRDHITNDPYETTHAKHIREAAIILTNAMENLQRANYTALNNEAQQVRQSAESIDPNTLTLNQREAVKSFFDRSAELLRKMN